MRKTRDMKFIHDMLIKMDSRLDELAETSVKHEENLKEHMKRSLANEQAVELLAEELKPVKKHVDEVQFLFKLIAIVGSIIVASVTIWQALR